MMVEGLVDFFRIAPAKNLIPHKSITCRSMTFLVVLVFCQNASYTAVMRAVSNRDGFYNRSELVCSNYLLQERVQPGTWS